MSEKENSIPKPTIRNTPPVKPPVTSVDVEEPKVADIHEEEDLGSGEMPNQGVDPTVETDLVKRFLGIFIDGVVAGVIASVIGFATGSGFLQYATMGLVMLTRDSLPILEGQSIGKKIMKTKAVKADGSSLSGDWVTGATRNILFALPYVGLVEGFIFLSRSGKPESGFRLGDEWAKTKVISVE